MIANPAACDLQIMSFATSFLTSLLPGILLKKTLVLIHSLSLSQKLVVVDEIYLKGQFIGTSATLCVGSPYVFLRLILRIRKQK